MKIRSYLAALALLFAFASPPLLATVDDNGPRVAYTASGGQTAFTYTFEILAATDLKVYKNGTLLAYSTDYTVSGVGAQSGGTVTLLSAASLNDTVVIYRDQAVARTTDYQAGAKLNPDTLDLDLDRVVLGVQQIERDVVRSLHVAPSDTHPTSGMELPAPSSRANKYLAFDTDGDVTLTAGTAAATPSSLTSITDAGSIYASTNVEDALQEIGTAARTFGTIALLKAGSARYDGEVVAVSCYYTCTTPDGGGGWFKYDTTSAATDNGGTTIKPTAVSGAGRWQRIINGHVSARQFGVTFDGVTNDAVAWAALWTYHGANEVPVVIEAGTSITNSALTVTGSAPISGFSRADTIIKAGAAMASVIEFQGVNCSGADFTIDGNDLATNAISLNGCSRGRFKTIEAKGAVRDGWAGSATGNQNGTLLDNCQGRSNGGTYSTGTASSTAASSVVTFSGADVAAAGIQTGDWIRINAGEPYEIATVDGPTQVTLAYNTGITTQPNVAFTIYYGNGLNQLKGPNNNVWTVLKGDYSSNGAAGVRLTNLLNFTAVNPIAFDNGLFGFQHGALHVSTTSQDSTLISPYTEDNGYASHALVNTDGLTIIEPSFDQDTDNLEDVWIARNGIEGPEGGKFWNIIYRGVSHVPNRVKANSAGYVLNGLESVKTSTQTSNDLVITLEQPANPDFAAPITLNTPTVNGKTVQFISTGSGTINGVAATTGVYFTGDYTSYSAWFVKPDSWIVIPNTQRAVTVLNKNTTAVGNVGGGTDNLMTYALPANMLSENARGVRITAWGTTANNTNPKTATMVFGGTTIATQALTVSEVGRWRITGTVLRTGASAQDWNSLLISSPAAIIKQDLGAATETDTAAITIKCTGAVTDGGGGINNNDIVQEGMLVEFLN